MPRGSGKFAAALELAKQNNRNVAEKVAAWAGIRINDHTGSQLEPLGDVRVRQALNLAFDGQAMLDADGNGLGVYTNQVFAAGYPGYDDELNRAAGANIEEAKKLLAEAGYADGFDVTLPMAPGFQLWQATVEQAFKDVGLRLKWDEYQMADYQDKAGNYPMFLVSVAVDAERVATIARHLTVPQWYMPEPDISQFPELQKQINEALAAPRCDEQNKEIRELNAMLVDEACFVPWYQTKNVFVTDASIVLEPVTGMMFPTLRQSQPAK